MEIRFILTEYIKHLMEQAVYDKLEDSTFVGRIPLCKGLISFANNLRECEYKLQSTLEDWIFLGLKLNHPLPVVFEINLNKEPVYEQVESM